MWNEQTHKDGRWSGFSRVFSKVSNEFILHNILLWKISCKKFSFWNIEVRTWKGCELFLQCRSATCRTSPSPQPAGDLEFLRRDCPTSALSVSPRLASRSNAGETSDGKKVAPPPRLRAPFQGGPSRWAGPRGRGGAIAEGRAWRAGLRGTRIVRAGRDPARRGPCGGRGHGFFRELPASWVCEWRRWEPERPRGIWGFGETPTRFVRGWGESFGPGCSGADGSVPPPPQMPVPPGCGPKSCGHPVAGCLWFDCLRHTAFPVPAFS